MLQNVKVDVVYFSKASDFEMEFNLCGCCRMRLLTEKGDGTVKRFVENLATAVSRSRVIIACGPVTGENSIIKTVATAINAPLSKTDNAAFGISSEDSEIIEGALPLVTSEGVFGGCVIESGPQSIILLTEDKVTRKNLMKNLIHPYIAELSIIPQDENAVPLKTEEEKLAEEITEQLSDENTEEAESTQEAALEQAEEEADAVQETLPIFEDGETASQPQEIEETAKPETATENTAEDTKELPVKEEEQAELKPEKAEIKEQAGSVKPKGEIEFIMDSDFAAPIDFTLGAAETDTGFITGDDEDDFVPEIPKIPEAPKKEKGTFIVKPDSNTSEGLSKEPEKNSKGINVTILVICVILIICLAMTAVLLIGIPAARNQDVMSYIKEIFTSGASSV